MKTSKQNVLHPIPALIRAHPCNPWLTIEFWVLGFEFWVLGFELRKHPAPGRINARLRAASPR
jgi:hypothetical protein